MTGGESDSTTPASQQNSMVFKIFDEESQPTPTLTSGKAMPRQSDTIQDDVFLPPGERGLCFKTPNPFQSGKIPHREQTLSKNFAEKRESLSVDVVNGHQNNTLCASPEDTLDFAKAAKIASTPSSCASGLKVVSPDTGTRTETSGVTTEPETISQQIRDLSPIQEASVERSCSQASGLTSTSSQGSVSGGQANPQLSSRKQNHSASSPDANDQNPVCTVLEDPCSQSLRQRLLDQLDLRSFPNFHSEDGYLPTVKEDDLLVLGKETFFTFSKMDFKSFSIFEGMGDGYIAIKVERCAVPWDFYIRSRLRERLARDSQAPVHDAGRCYQFRDGCITIHQAFPQETLSSQVAEGSFEKIVMAMAIQTVELVRRMHSCSLIHGALCADTLVMNCPYDEELDQAVVALDFSCSLDLEMQPEVTAARSLTSAQGFITQGLLSPTASPYQVDLLGVAETVHCLLKRVRWPVNDKSKWTLQKYQEAESSDPNGMFWSKFFRTLLCPGDRSSVSVLTELLEDMKKSDLAC
ncbi:hypothetical protein UPYG_G00276570 [Umbra pygmaea]|uniref:Protein kinase domain-containing protein n=1 Tax=Umbra pygmaea TaxID=75934 RepID=A0ABD0WR33_UMBPY